MIFRFPTIGLCVLTALALAVGGCGDSDIPENEKLPAGLSQDLLAEFERIQARVDANVSGACDDIFEGVDGGNFDAVSALLGSVPDNVAPEIRSALSESVDRLQELVDGECDEIRASEQEVVPEETTPEETIPTDTETTPTETETTPTETETTPTTPPDPDDGNGDGNGNGNGNGNGPDGEGPPGQDGGGVEVPGL